MKHVNKFDNFLNETNQGVSWETIKKNSIYAFRSMLSRDNISIIPLLAVMKTKEMINSEDLKLSSTRNFVMKLKTEIEEMINNLDIREYHLLVETFPKVFPKFIVDGNCNIVLGEKGWYFYKK